MAAAADSSSESTPSCSPIRKVLILGAGTMGAEVTAQCAAYGFHVTLYDINQQQLDAAQKRLQQMLAEQAQRGAISVEDGEKAWALIHFTTSAEEAAANADFVSESVTESLKVKRELFTQFAALCPADTLFTTNSSYFVPSMMAKSLPRPENFAAFHFHNPVWFANVVDIMPHPTTSSETVEKLSQFARQIGQTPIVELKENHGYVFNAMLRDFLSTAVSLASRGIADVTDIDRAWMGVTKMPIGPFGMIDTIGLDTVHDIVSFWGAAAKDPQAKANAQWLKSVVEQGKLGAKMGEGFYKYPQPAYAQPDFLMQPGSPLANSGLKKSPTNSRPDMVLPTTTEPSNSTGTSATKTELQSTGSFARWTLTAQPTGAVPTGAIKFFGPVLIMGQGPAADACEKYLQDQGASSFRLPAFEELSHAIDYCADLFAREDIPHLFLLSGLDPTAATTWNSAAVSQRNVAGLLLPYFVCRAWYRQRLERGVLDRSTLLAAVNLGGSLGLLPPVVAAEGGGMAGLLKAVHMEGIASGLLGSGTAGVFGPQTRLVDFQGNESPLVVAQKVGLEFGTLIQGAESPLTDPEDAFRRHAELEVGYRRGQRHFIRLRNSPLPQPGTADHSGIQAGDTWVVTGGARGITSLVAKTIATRYQVKLELLGASPLPREDYLSLSDEEIAERKRAIMTGAYASGEKPNVAWERVARGIEIQRTLAELHACGISAEYHSCNVSDPVALGQVLQTIRQQRGPIRAVLHGAGVEDTGRFEKKELKGVQRTLGPKFSGTLGLMELTAQDPLNWFISFGSLSGRFGGVGQTDYAMANEVLAKLMDWYRGRRPECKSLCIHWPGWDEVGMAARPASRFSLERSGHSLLPPSEGFQLLMQELCAGAPDCEVLFMKPEEVPQTACESR